MKLLAQCDTRWRQIRSSAPLSSTALLATLAILMVCPLQVQAAFISSPGVPAVYDDVLDITWYTNVSFIQGFNNATNAAANFSLNVDGTIYDDWRLPNPNLDGVGSVSQYSGAGCTNNSAGCVDNELAYNVHFNDLSVFSGYLVNQSYFTSFTEFNPAFPPFGQTVVWLQNTTPTLLMGQQGLSVTAGAFFVHPGNILPIPEPASALLALTTVLGLAGPRRRRHARRDTLI